MTTGRAFDRLVNFSDAVVAVAVTLLVLPIIDIRGTASEETVWAIIGDHVSELFAYAFTFVVVGIMWLSHSRTFNRLRGFDGTIFMLNLLWLLGIALLPWASALYSEGIGVAESEFTGGEGLGGAGMFYWCTIAWISVIPTVMVLHARRRPELIDPEASGPPRHPLRLLVYPVVFILFGIVTMVSPTIGSWMPLLLIPIGIFFGHAERRMAQEESTHA